MKNLKYLAALTIPITAIISIYYKGIWVFITPVYVFIMIPILELLLAKNPSNYSESEIKTKKVNSLFDWMLYLNLPIIYALLFWALIEVSLKTLEVYEFIGIVISVGIVLGGNGINVAHELGHRLKTNERFLGKLLLLPSLYMHFFIEHNFGHHLHAATKEDPATARYKQSVYSFWITSVFRQYISAWKIQIKLLKNNNISNQLNYVKYTVTLSLLFRYIILPCDPAGSRATLCFLAASTTLAPPTQLVSVSLYQSSGSLYDAAV